MRPYSATGNRDVSKQLLHTLPRGYVMHGDVMRKHCRAMDSRRLADFLIVSSGPALRFIRTGDRPWK